MELYKQTVVEYWKICAERKETEGAVVIFFNLYDLQSKHGKTVLIEVPSTFTIFTQDSCPTTITFIFLWLQ